MSHRTSPRLLSSNASGDDDGIKDAAVVTNTVTPDASRPGPPPSGKTPSPPSTTGGKSDSDDDNDESMNECSPPRQFVLDGVHYPSYPAMVQAKRARNQKVLEQTGLLDMKAAVQRQRDDGKVRRREQRKKAKEQQQSMPQRQSSRLRGETASGLYIADEHGGRFTFRSNADDHVSAQDVRDNRTTAESAAPKYFDDRINDGRVLSLDDAIELAGPRWVADEAATEVKTLFEHTLAPYKGIQQSRGIHNGDAKRDPQTLVAELSLDDADKAVRKVVPDRIYGMAMHPMRNNIVVAAGDKQGHVGIWNLNDLACLLRPHSRPVNAVHWTKQGDLLSASYDGTVRRCHVETQQWDQVFATYDGSLEYQDRLGAGLLDDAGDYWTQFLAADHRNDDCFFVSTSAGTAMHVDLRRRGSVTFHEKLSEKKVNTLSLHPNGYTLISGGLDTIVAVWDIRKFNTNTTSGNKRQRSGPSPLATLPCTKSVNSAFFSPSGAHMVATTMNHRLEIVHDLHLASGTVQKATHSVRHDNMTGRWLTTFNATWHPTLDIFCVGSMGRPRAMDVYNARGTHLRAVTGAALTAVASRCCFHVAQDRLILAGGNSSGRVAIAQ